MKHTLNTIAARAGLKRRQVEGARMFLERHTLASISARRLRRQGRILCYHCVGQPEFGVNDVTPECFRRQIELALESGYRFVPAAAIASGQSSAKELAVTFDDGFRSVLTQAAPILRDYNIPFTVFVVSEWPDRKETWQESSVLSWSDLDRLQAFGADLGSHSATHCDFGEVGIERAWSELDRSRSTLQARLGAAPDVFAIPLGQSANWTAAAGKAAREIGYTTIFAQSEESRPEGTVGRTFVTHYDNDRLFKALLDGAYDRWEEWVWKH